RFFRTEAGSWRRYELWAGPRRGRRARLGRGGHLAIGQIPGMAGRVEVVAIDPSAAFRKALREYLPHVAVSVEEFHLIKLANDALTRVRQRLTRDHHGRRGRKVDASWANRKLLLRGASRSRSVDCWTPPP